MTMDRVYNHPHQQHGFQQPHHHQTYLPQNNQHTAPPAAIQQPQQSTLPPQQATHHSAQSSTRLNQGHLILHHQHYLPATYTNQATINDGAAPVLHRPVHLPPPPPPPQQHYAAPASNHHPNEPRTSRDISPENPTIFPINTVDLRSLSHHTTSDSNLTQNQLTHHATHHHPHLDQRHPPHHHRNSLQQHPYYADIRSDYLIQPNSQRQQSTASATAIIHQQQHQHYLQQQQVLAPNFRHSIGTAPVDSGNAKCNVEQNSDSVQDHFTEQVIQAILAAKEALEKPIEARDDHDILLIDNLCSLVHGFNVFPKTVRRALAAQAVLIVIDERGKELIVHNEELDSFCVLIFGECEQLNANKTVPIRYYHVGDAFGVCEPTTETVRFNGHMITRCENSAFLCVKRDDFYTILTDPANYPNKEIIRHRDREGNVICVSEFRLDRKSSGPLWSYHSKYDNPFKIVLPDGHIITKATKSCLLSALVDGYEKVDPGYLDDFLLLYRVFMTFDQKDKEKNLPPGMVKLCLTLYNWLEISNCRDKVIRIVLSWLSSYYHDFELNADFAHQFFKSLENRLLSLAMGNQLHLLHATLSMKSKVRHVTISRSSREQPLPFAISGGYEKNCGIFVTQIFGSNDNDATSDSFINHLNQRPSQDNPRLPIIPPRNRANLVPNIQKSSVHLRPGDQILEANGTNFAAIKLVEAQKKLDMSTHLSLTVRYNPSAFYEMRALPEGRRKSSISSVSSASPFTSSNSQSRFTFNPQDQARQLEPYPPASPLFSTNANFGFRSIVKSGVKTDKSKLTSLINSSKQFVRQIRDSTAQSASGSVETSSKTSDNISDDQSNVSDLDKAKSNSDLSNLRDKDRQIESGLSSVVRNDELNYLAITDQNLNGLNQSLINVLRVFNAANNEFRYLLVHEETTAREVVMVAVREFNLTSNSGSHPSSICEKAAVSSLDWHLYEVSVVAESKTIKQKCLSEQTSRLAERASLCSRYYIKNNSQSSFGPSRLDMGDDALVNEILKESPAAVTLTSLNATLLAVELTLADFDKFKSVEPQHFVYDTFFDCSERKNGATNTGNAGSVDGASLKSSSSDGQDGDSLAALSKARIIPKSWMKEYQEFADVSNKEMFWVVCEILSERNLARRVKIVKQFVRVADVCSQLRNYNSMFAIISGLGHSCISRLRRTFEKLKPKYKNQLEKMRCFFDPSGNMANYRTCLSETPPPAIPLFPLIKKDFTFTKEGRSIFVRETNDQSDDDEMCGSNLDTIRRKIRPGGDLLAVKSDLNDHTRPVNITSLPNKTSAESENILVNFAEIREFSKRVKSVINFSSVPYSSDLLTNTKDSQRTQAQIKKMHEEWQMRKRIRHYMSQTLNIREVKHDQVDNVAPRQNGNLVNSKINITFDERTLYTRSLEIEPELNARLQTQASERPNRELTALQVQLQPQNLPLGPPALNMLPPPLSAANSSPTLSKSSSLSSCSSFNHPNQHSGPSFHANRVSGTNLSSSVGKFGTESTESLRKLRALSENVSEDWRSYQGAGGQGSEQRHKGLAATKIFQAKSNR